MPANTLNNLRVWEFRGSFRYLGTEQPKPIRSGRLDRYDGDDVMQVLMKFDVSERSSFQRSIDAVEGRFRFAAGQAPENRFDFKKVADEL